MKSNFILLLSIIFSTLLVSCSDPKDKVIDEYAALIVEINKAIISNDNKSFTDLKAREKDLYARADKLGLNLNDHSSLTPEQAARLDESRQEIEILLKNSHPPLDIE